MSKANTFNYRAWFDTAADGNIKQLLAWHKAGDLKKAYDPSIVAAIVPSGRPRAQHFVDQISNDTALHCAIRNHQYEYAAALMKLFSWPPQFNKKGETALHLVAECLAIEKGEELKKAKQVFSALIGAGYSPGPSDKESAGFIKRLMKNLRDESDVHDIVEQCLGLGAEFDETDFERAITARQPEIMKVFLASDAGCVSEKKSGINSLHYAAASWDRRDDRDVNSPLRQIVRILIAAGVDHEAEIQEDSGQKVPMKDMFCNPSGYQFFIEAFHEVQAAKIAENTPEVRGSTRAVRL